jgi:hypothetical protein
VVEMGAGDCMRAACDAHLCADGPDVISTCSYRWS